MPFADNSFDFVMSCVGAMFAPRRQATADELVRVCRPGGTIGMVNWTPEGFIGNLFATMKPYAPPPPPGASPPPLWGDKAYVRNLFGERVTGLQARRREVVMDHCANPLEFREYWKRNYGPTIAVYRFNEDRPDRIEQLDRDFLSFSPRGIGQPSPAGRRTMRSTCWSPPSSVSCKARQDANPRYMLHFGFFCVFSRGGRVRSRLARALVQPEWRVFVAEQQRVRANTEHPPIDSEQEVEQPPGIAAGEQQGRDDDHHNHAEQRNGRGSRVVEVIARVHHPADDRRDHEVMRNGQQPRLTSTRPRDKRSGLSTSKSAGWSALWNVNGGYLSVPSAL